MDVCKLVLAALLSAAFAAEAGSADLKVIANPNLQISEISADDLKGIFLATKTSLREGGRVQPVFTSRGSTFAEFSEEYLDKSETALRTYYRSLVFTGKCQMPRSFDSDAGVMDYVARTPGAIGYIRGAEPISGVRILRVK